MTAVFLLSLYILYSIYISYALTANNKKYLTSFASNHWVLTSYWFLLPHCFEADLPMLYIHCQPKLIKSIFIVSPNQKSAQMYKEGDKIKSQEQDLGLNYLGRYLRHNDLQSMGKKRRKQMPQLEFYLKERERTMIESSRFCEICGGWGWILNSFLGHQPFVSKFNGFNIYYWYSTLLNEIPFFMQLCSYQRSLLESWVSLLAELLSFGD